jgi:hypothetical protein
MFFDVLLKYVLSFQEQLGTQITNDFNAAFSAENARSFSPSKQLAEACMVKQMFNNYLHI